MASGSKSPSASSTAALVAALLLQLVGASRLSMPTLHANTAQHANEVHITSAHSSAASRSGASASQRRVGGAHAVTHPGARLAHSSAVGPHGKPTARAAARTVSTPQRHAKLDKARRRPPHKGKIILKAPPPTAKASAKKRTRPSASTAQRRKKPQPRPHRQFAERAPRRKPAKHAPHRAPTKKASAARPHAKPSVRATPHASTSAASRQPKGSAQFAGTLLMVPSHNSAEVSLMLREANGTAYSLDFGRPLHGPPGGLQPMQLVVVVGVLDAATATVAVSSGEQASYDQEQRIWFGNDGPPTQMRVLFGMISWCNQTAGFTPQQWSQVIGGPPGSQTVAGHFNDVSFGSTVLDSYDIVQADVGCPSTTNQTCTGISQATWNSYMQSVWTAATAQGLDPTSYGATVFAFPNMLGNCWAGLAVIGCYGDYTCWTYLNGASALNTAVIVHEMGHNLGFLHAGYLDANGNLVEYGDGSSTMGSGSQTYGLTGYNTPEEYQMGWITPAELDGGRLTPGATVTLSTPALTRSSSHGVRIRPTWNAALPSVFLGFRQREAFDADLAAPFPGATSVYTWQGQGYRDYYETYFQGIVQTGSSFYHPASGLTVRQLSVSADGGSATLTVCRNSTAAETGALCFNGLDDDCDGLADADDPSCAAARPPPPMLMAGSSVAVSPPPVASPPPPSPPPPPPPLAGYDWSRLPSSAAGTSYQVMMCQKGTYVTSLTVYVSSNHYSNTGNPNYLGGFGIRCSDGSVNSYVLPGIQSYQAFSSGQGFSNISGYTGGPWYSEAGLAKAVFGVGQAGPSAPLDTAPTTFAYAPPTPGAVLAGVAAAQCLWPPPAGGYGAVLCNMQFAFAPAGVVSSPPPAPPPASPPPLSGAGSLDTSEVLGNAPASAAPTAPKALQCALGSYVDAVTVHLSHTVVTGYTLQYVGGLVVHCNDGTSFSNILSSAYQPQTVSQPNGFTSISGLVGQSWSTVQYISSPDYEAGALKALLGVGDTADTATAFDYSCPPGDVLAGLSASTCTWLGQAGAVFCQLQFTCTHSSDLVAPPALLAGPWSAVVGAVPLPSFSPTSATQIACNPGAFVQQLWVASSNVVYPADGSVSFLGGLILVCSDTSTRSYVLNNTAGLKVFSSTTGYSTVTGSTGTSGSYEQGLLKSLMGFGDATSARSAAFSFSCPSGQLLAGFAAQQCTVQAGYPNTGFCNVQFQCTVLAASPPPPALPRPPPPALLTKSPPPPIRLSPPPPVQSAASPPPPPRQAAVQSPPPPVVTSAPPPLPPPPPAQRFGPPPPSPAPPAPPVLPPPRPPTPPPPTQRSPPPPSPRPSPPPASPPPPPPPSPPPPSPPPPRPSPPPPSPSPPPPSPPPPPPPSPPPPSPPPPNPPLRSVGSADATAPTAPVTPTAAPVLAVTAAPISSPTVPAPAPVPVAQTVATPVPVAQPVPSPQPVTVSAPQPVPVPQPTPTPVAATPAPVFVPRAGVPAPTPQPVLKPTAAPVPKPTAAPVKKPSAKPVPKPTAGSKASTSQRTGTDEPALSAGKKHPTPKPAKRKPVRKPAKRPVRKPAKHPAPRGA